LVRWKTGIDRRKETRDVAYNIAKQLTENTPTPTPRVVSNALV